MLCWHFTLAVCCKSHRHRSTPEETFSKKNQNKLLALDPTLTSAAPSGQSKIWTPCCCFESFQKLLQAGKLFIFSSASFPPLLPFPSSIFLTWAKFCQCYSPSCLHFPELSFASAILLHVFIFLPPVFPGSCTTCSCADLKVSLHGKENCSLKHLLVDCCIPITYNFLGRFKCFLHDFPVFRTSFWRKNECDYSWQFSLDNPQTKFLSSTSNFYHVWHRGGSCNDTMFQKFPQN